MVEDEDVKDIWDSACHSYISLGVQGATLYSVSQQIRLSGCIIQLPYRPHLPKVRQTSFGFPRSAL